MGVGCEGDLEGGLGKRRFGPKNMTQEVHKGEVEWNLEDVELVPTSNVIWRTDERIQIEQLLLMGGVEQNLGPESGFPIKIISILMHDVCIWVFDSAIWTTKSGKSFDMVRAALTYFYLGFMPHRCMARIAIEVASIAKEGYTDQKY